MNFEDFINQFSKQSELDIKVFALLTCIYLKEIELISLLFQDHQEDDIIKYLEENDYIKILDNSYELRLKSIKLFDIPIKISNLVKNWIDEYINLFPKGIKSGGRYIRANKTDVTNKMNFFIKKYKYSKDTILLATKAYITEKEKINWSYIQCADYFIDKDSKSTLAGYCDNYKDEINDDWTKLTV